MMLNKMLAEAEKIAIGGHVRPDGDCVGSCMAMYQYLKDNYKEKQIDVYLEDIPDPFRFIEATKDIRHEVPADTQYDLFICQDCGDRERLGFSAVLFDEAANTFCIDHHISNQNFADENYVVPEASSTSELVYNLLDKEKITKEIAEALYLGIVHDTGVFQYSCAGPETFVAAAELLKKGVDAPKLITETYYEKTYAQNKILGKALKDSTLILDGKCVTSCVTQKEMAEYGVTPKDLDAIVSNLRNTKGVEVAVFLYELEENTFKVSLRASREVNVSRVAQHFGGGGHVKAAGATMTGEPAEIIGKLSEQIELQLREM